MKNIFAILFIIGLYSCVGSKLDYQNQQIIDDNINIPAVVNIPDFVDKDKNKNFFFKGSFAEALSEEKEQIINFKSNSLKPTVLIFSSEFCQSCQEEAEKLSEELKHKNIVNTPSNVNLYTIMVEDDILAAWFFKQDWNISWSIGYDKNSIFEKICIKPQTPCTVVLDPKKGILINKIGSLSLNEIEELTGKWK